MKKLFGKQPTQQVKPIERYPCPFYGFHAGFGALIDSEGNQCALVEDACSPCYLEMRGKIPSINNCIHSNLYKIAEKEGIDMQVFPREFTSPKGNKWKGISFKEWEDYVMNRAPHKTKVLPLTLGLIIISPEDSN